MLLRLRLHQVIQNEGMYPTGALLLQWPSMSYNKRHNNPISGLWTQGEEWRRYRSFMQKGLMAPAVARSYVPAIAKAAEHASMAMPLVMTSPKPNPKSAPLFTQLALASYRRSKHDARASAFSCTSIAMTKVSFLRC